MSRKIVAAGIALGLAAAAPNQAQASCSNTTLQICASVTAFYNGSGHLIIRAWNLYGSQGVSHIMTFVGIGSSTWTGTATLNSVTFNGVLINTWKKATNINQNPVGAELDFAAAGKNGVNSGLVGCSAVIPPGQYISSCTPGTAPYLELDFTTSSQIDLSNAITGWHSQVVNGTSCSLWVDSNGKVAGSTNPGDAGDCSSVAVPEPISLVLLGTGLASMGGAGLVRRRKKEEQV